MNKKLKLGLLVFFIGLVGVFSSLAMEVPLPEEMEKMISEVFTPLQFKLLSLINPIILLIVTVLIGTLLYDKVSLKLPVLENLIDKNKKALTSGILKFGIIGGVISGILITITAVLFNPILPTEFLEIGENFKPPLITRFLYGGLTEEILIRFGIMTFFVWLLFKISGKLNATVYWIGILVSAIIFGFGHLPFVYAMIDTPTTELLFYIILGNAVGGIVFGWLYWKKGLETAMIGHIFAHIIMLTGENILNI
ncbi:CPBP family intramembrane metalloprotease [Maribacter algarum]|uniref:CPBP family intramembrane metalloprotease n=1 Tax=Maribacter algarum (ex Zhang et al. 2020) TaxID=2578118 RepID=A0A5S3PRS0_9FLAO|nr:CPBP family intramembrane glutamic endopeptidase [Maribacter algarum]TMM57456.1 CPBP family intramembrane metalloprotease [Maribacter algarum]